VAARMNGLLTRLWRLGRPVQWRFLWLMHAKFICGVTGVIRDEDGRVLLLRHRLWPESRQWGFPTGYANKGERHEDTIIREVREETGLTVKPGRLPAGSTASPWTAGKSWTPGYSARTSYPRACRTPTASWQRAEANAGSGAACGRGKVHH
jgi:8-oxo-dGTP pyrophosphatase MutT (NUDIX family)